MRCFVLLASLLSYILSYFLSYFWVAAQAPQKDFFLLLLLVGWNPGFTGKLGWLDDSRCLEMITDDRRRSVFAVAIRGTVNSY